MKKILALITCGLLCVLLSACDPSTYLLTEDMVSNVTRVELIDYDNRDQKHFVSWVPDHTADLLPFRNSNAALVETLPAEKLDDFLSQFLQSNILNRYYAYNSPKGICLKLIYSNGNFMIIWSNYEYNSFAGYIGIYSADGEVEEFIGSFSSIAYFKALVNGFFDYQLPES